MKWKNSRRSKNIEDFRDNTTKAYKKEATKSKITEQVMDGHSSVTDPTSLKKISTTKNTSGTNRFTNIKRIVSGKSVGLAVKNRKLDTPKSIQKLQKPKKGKKLKS
jgi:hypothetical protein